MPHFRPVMGTTFVFRYASPATSCGLLRSNYITFIAVVCSSQGSCVDLGASVAVVTMNTNCNSCGMCGDCSEKDYWIRRGECEMLKLLKLLGRTATVFLPDVPSMRAA